MKDFKFEPLSEEQHQAIIENNKRKLRQEQLRNGRNIIISITIFLVIPGLWIRHRTILAEKCSKLSYGHPADVTREECGNLYFQTYEYWTPTGGKQRTSAPPEVWCIYSLRDVKYDAPCPTPP
jgi:hypothetical protein